MPSGDSYEVKTLTQFFPVVIAKFLKTPNLKNIYELLLLLIY